MVIRYLRRPPKPATRKTAVQKSTSAGVAGVIPARADAVVILAGEHAALAQALAYFCAACGREHPSGGVRQCDIARADGEILSVINRDLP